ncbi:Ergothioneine biosynthesis protein EgtB [Tenacibaculum sp. 190130A14a]|uniref:Ergothioneine biosynthesis protein EgtB n=1 Tax=Tenacibaculum polynesiense TaxID=3137857 RepID=A0ABM9P8C3_9FLAO
MNQPNLHQRFNRVRAYTEDICKPLQTEDYVVQASTFASPAKWHLAHTTWFFEEFVLKTHIHNYQVYDPNFSFLFNSYYNNVGERVFRANRGTITRPNVTEVYGYRAYVNKYMLQFLSGTYTKDIEEIVELGLHHEQQHQELLITDIKFMLGSNPIFPVYQKGASLINSENTTLGFIKIEEGLYEIGHKGNEFCYDNELGVHKVFLNDFEISSALVTNKEYIEFIEDKGYSNFNLWLDAGWTWVTENTINSPLYWYKIDNEWFHFTLSGLQKVNPNAILTHVSFYEAAAFAEWKKMRLPTEFEWEVASKKMEWGKRWEWTYSAYLPYPNFKKAAGAIGEYNGKFMINQMVLRGASVATSPNHSRYTYRNFFHPNERWQFTGIRLAK